MKSKVWGVIILTVVSLAACKPSREEAIQKINIAEDSLKAGFSKGAPEDRLVENAIKSYVDFADDYPKDSLAAHFLIKGGDYNRVLKKYDKAIELYQKVEKNFEGSEAAANALFLQGFVYENEIKDLDKAKERYNTFLQKYPNHQLATAAKYSIQNLGVSPEELVKQFEDKQQAQDSLTAKTDSAH
jgi:outer membrane protein assembly factor BamD (BamD/ComL family)